MSEEESLREVERQFNIALQPTEEAQAVREQILAQVQENPIDFIILAAKIIRLEPISLSAAQYAITQIQNLIKQTNTITFSRLLSFWENLGEEGRTIVKESILRALLFDNEIMNNCASYSLALIAKIEFNQKSWLEILDIINEMIRSSETSEMAKVALMNSLALITEQKIKWVVIRSKDHIIQLILNLCNDIILDAEGDDKLKKYALIIINNIEKYFLYLKIKEEVIQTISTILIQSGINQNDELIKEFYDCVTSFLITYNKKIADVEEIHNPFFTAIAEDLQSDDPKRRTLALRALRKIMKNEVINLKLESTEYISILKNYIEDLIPLVVANLNVLSEGDDAIEYSSSDDMSIATIAMRCLLQISKVYKKNVLEFAEGFMEQISSEDWTEVAAGLEGLIACFKIPINDGNSDNSLQDLYLSLLTPDQNGDAMIFQYIATENIRIRSLAVKLVATSTKYSRNLLIREDVIQMLANLIIACINSENENAMIMGCNLLSKISGNFNNTMDSYTNKLSIVFQPIVEAFSQQLEQNAGNINVFNEIVNSLQSLILAAPISTREQRVLLAQHYLEMIGSIPQETDEEIKDCVIGNLITLVTLSIYSARPIPPDFAMQIFEFSYEHISAAFSQGVLNETAKNSLISLGLDALGSGETLRERCTELPMLLVSSLPSDENLANYENVFLCIGDIFRSFPGIIEDTNFLIEVCIRTASDFINLQNESPLTSVFYALTYIIMSNPDAAKEHIEQIFQFSQHVAEIEYNDDKNSMLTQREIYTSILPLNGAIIQAMKEEVAWVDQNKRILFHPALNLPIYYSNFLYEKSLYQFLNFTIQNIPRKTITKYNCLLNNKNIKQLLLLISKKRDRYSHSNEAKHLYNVINKT